MKLLLIHLSDIHFTAANNVIMDRCSAILNAVKNLDYSLDLCVVVVTGDIAYSGSDEQYMIAFEFFEHLKQLLSHNLSGPAQDHTLPVNLIVAPGNHDCDFDTNGPHRDLIVNSILGDTSPASDPTIVHTCTSVQKLFFEFLDVVEPFARQPASQHYPVNLSYEYNLSVQGNSLRIICCNTAWVSQLHETQGRLFFPDMAVPSAREDTDLVIAAFHHPYNWLESTNARSFRDRVESLADLVLTGHEHTTSWKTQDGSLGQTNFCVEGGVLQDNSDPKLSEFNVFVIDTTHYRKKYAHFRWDNDTYVLTKQSLLGEEGNGLGWTPYRLNGLRAIRQSHLADKMATFLEDPGINLRHGERGLLSLQDIYVYPDLLELRIQDDSFGQRVLGDRLLELLDSNSKIAITGDTESGKTALAKTLFLDFLQNGVVPVYVDGTSKPPRGDRVYGYIERLFSDQYSVVHLEAYRQTDKRLRAIIVDDYDKLPLTSPQKKAFLQSLSLSAQYLVVLSHDLTSDLEELSNPGALSPSSEEMVHYRIQPFGYVGRNNLIERWMLLGESTDPTDSTFLRQLQTINDTLNTIVGRNYVPSYPVYVLSVLQALDNATPIDITASTHGYFYELFIRTTLARGRTNKDFDIMASYLAYLAYRMQAEDLKILTTAELQSIHRGYEIQYDIKRPFETLTKQLVDQGILTSFNDGFRFKYSYIYNYFVASYMKDHIAEPEVREMLGEIARTVHTERNANILLFLAHLTKDPVVIDTLLTASRDLYPSYHPTELKDDIKFLAHLWSGLPDAVYEDNDPKANREAMLVEMDRNRPPDVGSDDFDVADDDPHMDVEDPVVQFLTALRHLEIMGQVLKNFPGSLEGSVKLGIARECFHLGLRSLTVVFEMIRLEQSEILKEMSQEIQHRHPSLAPWEVDSRAKESLTGLVHVLSYGLIKRVSKAVGSRDLFNTYERLMEESGTPAFSLINSALNLDNSSEFPYVLINHLASDFEDAPLPLSVLRHLVAAHFHLFPVDFKTKQRISSTIGIKYSNLHLSSPRARMLPSGGGVIPKQ